MVDEKYDAKRNGKKDEPVELNAAPATPADKDEYKKEVKKADAAKYDGIEAAIEKRRRSEEVALRLQQKAQQAHAERMKQKMVMVKAAHDSIPDILKKIDTEINKVIDDTGARVLHFHVPTGKDEHTDAVAVKVEGVIAALTELGYTVRKREVFTPPAVASVPEQKQDDDNNSDNGSVPLMISW